MKILVLQSRRRPEMLALEQGEYTRALAGTGTELEFRSTLADDFAYNHPPEFLGGIDGLIIAGSGEFDFDGGRADDDEARLVSKDILTRLTPLVTYVLENEFPLLGICYGHQIVGQVAGVSVENDHSQKKVGSFPVVLVAEGRADPLFAELPESFIGQYGHKDSLMSLPEGAVLLAASPNCKFSALRFGPNQYTLQFHPELTAEDVVVKLANSPGYLPESTDPNELIKPSTEASTLIPRWVALIGK